MKAIKITESNKINFKNREVDSWFVGEFPEKYIFQNQEFHGYKDRTDIHAEHGWVDLVNLPIGENQKRTSNIVEVEGGVAYEVVDLTPEEIEQKIISESESNRFNIESQIQQDLINQQVQQTVEAFDDETALENKDVFPFWSGDSVSYELDQRVKFLDGEIKLYKVVQAHTSQANWTPPTVPALFTEVAPPGVIPNWVQPTGAQDAYQIGDQVIHDNPNDGGNLWVYESTINANTQEPGRDGTLDRWWTPINPV